MVERFKAALARRQRPGSQSRGAIALSLLLVAALAAFVALPGARIAVAGEATPTPVRQNIQAQITVSPSNPTAGQQVTLGYVTSGTSPGPAGAVTWSFGDGVTLSVPANQPIQHSFPLAGIYTIQMTASDSRGNQISGSTTFRVSPAVSASATATPATARLPTATPSAAPPGMPVSYPAGWNLISGPSGSIVTGNAGPLYTYQPGDTDYETVLSGRQLRGGEAYWSYFPSVTATTIAIVSATSVSVQLPPGQPLMIGNPGNTTATVTGADSVVVFDPRTNGYAGVTFLLPGQGAWASSAAGGVVTIANIGASG